MLYLKYFGAIFFDSNDDGNMGQIVYSVILFTTGIIMVITSPYNVLEFHEWGKDFSMSMSLIICNTVNISSLISRLVVIYNVKFKHQKYKTTLEGFEIYIPMDSVALKHIKYFSITVIFLSTSIIIPINALKLYYIFNNHANPILMTTYYFFYYIHNLSMVCTELHFAIQCFVVYTKFRDINEKLIQINYEQNYYNYNVRYPFTVSRMTPRKNDDTPPCDIMYEKDFYCSKDKASPLANIIELLRIKHWLTREAVNDLQHLFIFQIGLSIICIVTVLLHDIYIEVFYSETYSTFFRPVFRSRFLFVGWMLQYSLRFCIIVITAHTTTKQVFINYMFILVYGLSSTVYVKYKLGEMYFTANLKQADSTRKIITEMNNRYIDSCSKEELLLFYNQLSIRSLEFTIFDVLTINNSLITSVMSAGATYILILVQYQSDKSKTTHKDHYSLSNGH